MNTKNYKIMIEIVSQNLEGGGGIQLEKCCFPQPSNTTVRKPVIMFYITQALFTILNKVVMK